MEESKVWAMLQGQVCEASSYLPPARSHAVSSTGRLCSNPQKPASMELAADRGHRHGNFPNYYAFHPPRERVDVLESTGLLSYIRRGLFTRPMPPAGDDGDDVNVDRRPRVNDGDLTSSGRRKKKPRIDEGGGEETDGDAFETEPKIRYCDLGCNAGELTMAMVEALLSSDQGTSGLGVECLGLDIDPQLIERANGHVQVDDSGNSAVGRGFPPRRGFEFMVCDLTSEEQHDGAYKRYAAACGEKGCGDGEQLFALTTIFSTTMWIHVHAGDEGLRRFLERASNATSRFLLVEPQPSACYRKANARLRKMGRPELEDVTSARLKMRQDIESEIEGVITRCGFRRVYVTESQTCEAEGGGSTTAQRQEAVTAWNRQLHLYERVKHK